MAWRNNILSADEAMGGNNCAVNVYYLYKVCHRLAEFSENCTDNM